MEEGFPQSRQSQVRGDRDHRGLGRGRGLVQQPVLGAVYLQAVSKVDTLTSAYIVGIGLVIGTPSLIICGWLSDIIGRNR